MRIDQRDPVTDKLVAAQQTGLVVPYPSEYRLRLGEARKGGDLLADLAQLGGGKTLVMTRPAEAFSHDIASQPRPVTLWPWLLALAILLFPLDVAVRRLSVTRSDLRRAGAVLRRRQT